MDIAQIIQTVAIYALPVIFAITVHEAAHGYAARYFGDNTAWALGRVTLNPIKHIDLFGTILLPLTLVLISSPIVIGAAKPVPVNFGNLRNPKSDMIWVALAGPASNFVQALAWGAAAIILQRMGSTEVFFLGMCSAGFTVNIALFVLNLFPLPPLDGGRILVGLLPYKQAVSVARIEPYGFFVIIVLLYLQVIDHLWMSPLSTITAEVLKALLLPLTFLFS